MSEVPPEQLNKEGLHRPLLFKEKDKMTLWNFDKPRKTMFDEIIRQDKKWNRQGPNAYFQNKKKGDILDSSKQCQATLYQSRGPTHKLSKLKYQSMIDIIQKDQKKRPGPGQYKEVHKGQNLKIDMNGQYRGLAKTSVEQLQFI